MRIVLNSEPKGEFLVRMEKEGFFVREADLGAIGFRGVPARAELFGKEPYIPLGAVPGLRLRFDERTLTLEIEAPPALLPRQTIDFAPPRREKVFSPPGEGAFLNYGLAYATGDSFSFDSLTATVQAGGWMRGGILQSDFSYTATPGDRLLVRLMTNYTRDRRDTLQRFVVGDLLASSGDLGGSVNLGGAGFSKIFAIDPYLVRYPVANLAGFASLPAEAQIYVDGTRIRTERIAPGEFELRNIVDYGGAGAVTVVLKDAFGREQRLVYPFYFTDALLRQGFHEYSYNAGFPRRAFGEKSDRYGRPAFSFFHRFGLSDGATVGFRGEGSTDRVNGGPTLSWRIGNAGVVSAAVSGSAGGAGAGGAGFVRYAYQDRRKNLRLAWKGFSRDYAILSTDAAAGAVRREVAAGAGYGMKEAGTLSVDFSDASRFSGPARRAAGVTYSWNVARDLAFFATLRRVRESGTATEVFAGLTWYPWREVSLSAGYKNAGGTGAETVQLLRNAPAGEGVGYRLFVERSGAEPAPAVTVDPYLQYNGRYGIYTGEFRTRFAEGGGTTDSSRLTAAGGIAWVGGRIGASRPINDSFGLVVVDNLANVRVMVNNQQVGRTDRDGKLFVPNLGSYFENQISIDHRDVPIDYTLSEAARVVSLPLRSGAVIRFEAKKFQAVTGSLALRQKKEARPLEFVEAKAVVHGKEIAFPTGKRGEFYLENLPPGTYAGAVEYNGMRCGFALAMPRSEETIVDLGVVDCVPAQ